MNILDIPGGPIGTSRRWDTQEEREAALMATIDGELRAMNWDACTSEVHARSTANHLLFAHEDKSYANDERWQPFVDHAHETAVALWRDCHDDCARKAVDDATGVLSAIFPTCETGA